MTAITDRPLRLLFVTEDDPLYVIRFFEVFFDEYPKDQIEIVGVSVQDAFHEPIWKTARRMLRFYGPIDFIRLCFRYIRVKLRGDSIAKLAARKGLPVVPCGSVNDPAYIAKARELQPDVIASVAAPEIFKKEIIGVPTLRAINIHSGRLPVYRGMMPNFWQLLHGEKHATVTVHEMVEKLDAGGILGTLEWPLKPKDSLDRVITGTKRDGARLMIDVLLKMKQGSCEPVPLDMTEKKYFSFPKPADVKAFRKRGHRML
ncbi:MAG: formyl transferase [Planctomycetota bacterium]|nr:MAG: formyl transferase [Planctomycetota bacterium]